jgi:hypothetical protein
MCWTEQRSILLIHALLVWSSSNRSQLHLSVLALPPSIGTNPPSGFVTPQLFVKVNDNKYTKERLSLFSHSPFRASKNSVTHKTVAKRFPLQQKTLFNCFVQSCATWCRASEGRNLHSWCNILVILIKLCPFVGSNFNNQLYSVLMS